MLVLLQTVYDIMNISLANENLKNRKILSRVGGGGSGSNIYILVLQYYQYFSTRHFVPSLKVKAGFFLPHLLIFQKLLISFTRLLLLSKPQKLNMGEDIIRWFICYLTNRRFLLTCVDNGSDIFNWESGKCLVYCFIYIFVNEMPDIFEHCEAFLYADDTVLVLPINNYVGGIAKLQADLQRLQTWAHNNLLIINEKKTKCMHFTFSTLCLFLNKKLPVAIPLLCASFICFSFSTVFLIMLEASPIYCSGL